MDINTEVGVVHDIRLQELRLYTDFGRCCRPLFIVERQALRIKKSHIRALQGEDVEQKLVWQVQLARSILASSLPFHECDKGFGECPEVLGKPSPAALS